HCVDDGFFLAEHRPHATVNDVVAHARAKANAELFDAVIAASNDGGTQVLSWKIGRGLQPGNGSAKCHRANPAVCLAVRGVKRVWKQHFCLATSENVPQYLIDALRPCG